MAGTMAGSTLVERRARVTVRVTRPNGAGGALTPSTYEFTENRMSITVSQGGGQYGNARVAIFGAAMDAMNNIARLWLEVLAPNNQDELLIDVWDGSAFIPFFQGVITWSAVNASSLPNVALEIEANDAMVAMNTVAEPFAQDTPMALESALAAILAPTGIVPSFAGNVPPLQAQRCYLLGTPMEQASTLLSYFPEVTWYVNLQRLVVRAVNAPIDAEAFPVNAQTGLIGYPTYSTSALSLAVLFDPRLRLGLPLDVRTEFDFVNRTRWLVGVLQHTLQPNTPGGQWVSQIAAQAWGSRGNNDGSIT